MNRTEIAWTDRSWNPVRGCSRVSAGCMGCYAARMAARFSDPGMWGHGFAKMTKAGPRWTGRVELVPEKLDEPLRLREPQRIFVNSTSDLFHEALPFADIARVFDVMLSTAGRGHTFQILTKRAARMLEFCSWAAENGLAPIPFVWLGVSVEDQKTADERIPLLLQTPAAVRFVSYEPALGPVSFDPFLRCEGCGYTEMDKRVECDHQLCKAPTPTLDLVIVGGESGPGARPCDVSWIRSVVQQCREAGVACFTKQWGSRPVEGGRPIRLRSAKGGDPSEWGDGAWPRELPA